MAEWMIELGEAATRELQKSFEDGPMVDDKGTRLLLERQIGSIGKLKVVVYSNEHPPPHFKVECSEGSCRFTIKDCAPLDARGLDRYRRNIRDWHERNKSQLIEQWNLSRPDGCPVGAYRE